MLGKGFFNVKPFNPNPYFDPVIVNLSGAQKFEDDTVFMPGRYRIEVAPGRDSDNAGYIVNMDFIEEITQPFIVRGYCGSDGVYGQPGSNSYSGIYKVNAVNAKNLALNSPVPAIDVTHIFGAGGGNVANSGSGIIPNSLYMSGGANCLGNGNFMRGGVYSNNMASGAGSCLHILPVGGTFGSDYLRAYHAAPVTGAGSAYGGAGIEGTSLGEKPGAWFTDGGNSPYGNGATTLGGAGQGIGCGGLRINNSLCGAGAYFNGTSWIDCHGTIQTSSAQSSYIRITYLGPLNEEVYYAWGSNPSVKEPRVFTKNLNPQVGDQAWFFDFDNARTSYDIKDATQVTIQSSETGIAPIVWVDNTGFYATGTLGPAVYTLNRMSNDDIIIKW